MTMMMTEVVLAVAVWLWRCGLGAATVGVAMAAVVAAAVAKVFGAVVVMIMRVVIS